MNRTTNTQTGSQQNVWLAGNILNQENTQAEKKRWWWHRLTMPPEISGPSTFLQREANRRARLLSTITFYLMLIDLLLIPATLFIPNHYVVFLCLFVLGVCFIAALFNRANKVFFASLLLVSILELALIAIIASTIPFDTGNLPLYDLVAITVLFAASLLPTPYIFVTMLFNIVFIGGELFLQRTVAGLATSTFQHYLQTQFYAALARPLALQIIVSAVIFLWVRSTSQAIARADRAEMIAKLEHDLAEQKSQLELGIKQILQTHTEIANGNLDVRAPLTSDNSLWPLANALNTLLTRFQRSYKAEQEIQRVQMMIPALVNKIQAAEQAQQPMPMFSRTSTHIDPILLCLSGKKLTIPPPAGVPPRK